MFVLLYRATGAGSKLRVRMPYGRVTLHHARVTAHKIFTARLEGRDPAAEKREAKRRGVAHRIDLGPHVADKTLNHRRARSQALPPSINDFSWLVEIEKHLALVMVPRLKSDRLALQDGWQRLALP